MKKCIDCNKYKSKKGKYCKPCGYKHRTRPVGLKYKIKSINPSWFKKGVPHPRALGVTPWNKKYENGYDAIHSWVERRMGKPRICWLCKDEEKNVYHWSNISGEYKRDLSDWQRLCVKCHSRYDYDKFGARKEFYE